MPSLLEVNSLSISRAHLILTFKRADGDGTGFSRVSFPFPSTSLTSSRLFLLFFFFNRHKVVTSPHISSSLLHSLEIPYSLLPSSIPRPIITNDRSPFSLLCQMNSVSLSIDTVYLCAIRGGRWTVMKIASFLLVSSQPSL